ncbi:MAG: HAD family phosphatase [Bacteroidota bacterium]
MFDKLKNVTNVIFDLGEVLLELDYQRIIEKLSEVAKKNKSFIEEIVVTDPLLQDFEIGKISPQQFRQGVNELLGTHLDDDAFDKIWNSMLKRLPKERMDLLREVGGRFQTFILSNTNAIHEVAFNQMIKEVTGRNSLHDFVQKCYFSHTIGLRKPNQSCYQFVIQDIGQDASQMLFLDDRLDNIEGAKKAGLQAIQITDADRQLNELFGK